MKLRAVLAKETAEACVRGFYGEQIDKVAAVQVKSLMSGIPGENWICHLGVKFKDGTAANALVGVTLVSPAEGEKEDKAEVFQFEMFPFSKEEKS